MTENTDNLDGQSSSPDSTKALAATAKNVKNVNRKSSRPDPRGGMRANEALGRDGEIIKRDVSDGSQWHIPENVTEPGWSYQWCRNSVLNQPDVTEMTIMHRAGWRPVPSSRLGGDGDGDIVREGLILMERPKALTEQAEREDQEKASRQVIDSTSRFDTNLKLSDAHRPVARTIRRERREKIDSAMRLALSDVDIPSE